MSRIKQIGTGLAFVGKGFRCFLQHKNLWWYGIIPTAINLLILAGLIFLLIHYFPLLADWIFGKSADTAGTSDFLLKFWHGLVTAIFWVLKLLIFIVILILILISCFVISMIVVSPFNELLSERVEILSAGTGDPDFNWSRFIKSIRRSVITSIQNAVFFLLVPIIILILNLIPIVGSILYLVIANLFAAFATGFIFVDYPMGRRLWNFRTRLKLASNQRYFLMGFGLPLLIPAFVFIFNSPLVVGGTLLFIEVNKNATQGS